MEQYPRYRSGNDLPPYRRPNHYQQVREPHQQARQPYPQQRKKSKRKALIALNAVLAVLLIGAVCVGGYIKWSLGKLERFDMQGALNGEDGSPEQTILVVGWDTRAKLSAADQRKYGKAGTSPGLADTIMLVRLNSQNKTASVLSIPRDTYVPIRSADGKVLRTAKINSAYNAGPGKGQQALAKTITANFGIPITHFVQVDFNGFKGVVNAVGGVQVPFDTPVRDSKSGLNIAKAGCVKLTGDDALAYVRSRYPETYKSGRWVPDSGIPDLDRIKRQQDFVRRVMSIAVGEARSNPLALKRMIDAGVSNVQLDSGFSTGEVGRVAKTFSAVEPSSVGMATLPTTSKKVGGEDVQVVDSSTSKTTIDRFLGRAQATTPTTAAAPPASVAKRTPSTGSIATPQKAACA